MFPSTYNCPDIFPKDALVILAVEVITRVAFILPATPTPPATINPPVEVYDETVELIKNKLPNCTLP